MKVPLHHVIHADAATYWKWFFDGPEIREFFVRGLGYKQFDIVEQAEDERALRRIARCHPHVAMPGPLEAVFRSGFKYLEEGVFDKESRVWTFKWIPSRFPERIVLEGWTRLEDRRDEPGRSDRTTEMVVLARFPAIGGLLERHTAGLLTEQWAVSARVSNEWLAARRPL